MTDILRLAVFDVDGTLVDSQHNIVAAMTAAWRRHGLDDPAPEAVRRIIGLSLVEACATLLPEAEHDLHVALAHAYKDAFFTLRQQPDHTEPLFPGAVAALDDLERDGWLLGIATGKTRQGLDAMLDRHGFKGRFLTLQTADHHPGKPHPSMVLQAMAELGVDADQTVMIGDTVYDMQMGKSAKAFAAAVAWGYHPPLELQGAGADILIDDYASLPVAIASLLGGRRQCA